MFAKRFATIFVVAALASYLGFASADCNVVSKAQWAGKEPTNVRYLARPVDLVIIQHTVSDSCNSDTKCKNIVRNIQRYHMGDLKYFDIGPSFLVGGNGKIYEGVGWLHEGAHTSGYNKRSIGVSFIGNFMESKPSQKMLDAVKALLKCGVKNGHLASDYYVVGHRQLIATDSPGNKLFKKIRAWPEWLEDTSVLNK